MTITARVQKQFFATAASATDELIRLPPTVATRYARSANGGTVADKTERTSRPQRRTNLWTIDEHERFLYGLELFPLGPWKEIAAIVGSKTTRQTMTHEQKYRQKIQRHSQRGGLPPKSVSSHDRHDNEAPGREMASALLTVLTPWNATVSSPTSVPTSFFDSELVDCELIALATELEHRFKAPAALAALEVHYYSF